MLFFAAGSGLAWFCLRRLLTRRERQRQQLLNEYIAEQEELNAAAEELLDFLVDIVNAAAISGDSEYLLAKRLHLILSTNRGEGKSLRAVFTRLADFCGHADAERDPRILEIDFGEWEMMLFDEITDPHLQEWYADHINIRVTGGESFMMQYLRVSNFLDELRGKPWKRVAVFAHGGVLVAARVYAGLVTPGDAFATLPPFGGLVRIAL